MTTSSKRLQKGFTLIELLTVIAIIGILAAIIIPTVGKVRDTATKSAASSNLRQIGQAALIFANDNREALPKMVSIAAGTFGQQVSSGGEENVSGFAAALAVGGGLNDATIWVVPTDKTGEKLIGASTVYTPATGGTSKAYTAASGGGSSFLELSLAYGVVLGLSTGDAATTPIAFTRGIGASTNGSWIAADGVYADDGGHIVFIGGNVQYYRTLGATAVTGELIGTDGNKTNVIVKTIKSSRKYIEETKTGAHGTATVGTGT